MEILGPNLNKDFMEGLEDWKGLYPGQKKKKKQQRQLKIKIFTQNLV